MLVSVCVCMLNVSVSVRRRGQARGAPAKALWKLALQLSVLSPGFDHRWGRRRKEQKANPSQWDVSRFGVWSFQVVALSGRDMPSVSVSLIPAD